MIQPIKDFDGDQPELGENNETTHIEDVWILFITCEALLPPFPQTI
jgi:hypothetical protein